MELFIDAGNSRLKWCWWTGSELQPGGAAEHAGHLPKSVLARWREQPAHGARVSCVAKPAVGRALQDELGAEFAGSRLDWLRTPAMGLGLTNSYAVAHKMGIDRWLALAGAHARGLGASCVVDIGTAITVDIADAQGHHQGGIIAPGPRVLASALRQATALPEAGADWPDELGLAQDTEDALLAGALHAACGVVERIWKIAESRHGCSSIWLTGGGAPGLRPYLEMPIVDAPDLLFEGLVVRSAEAPFPLLS